MRNNLSQKTVQLSKIIGQANALLEFYYEHPDTNFTVRELAKKIKLSSSTVQNQMKMMKQAGIISPTGSWISSGQNKLMKANYYVEKISQSGLVDYLEKELVASAIILFGSFRKGESVKESDIDLFVECAREKKLDLTHFEKALGHPIQLFTRNKITLLPKELLNNVVNGIKLRGYFTL